MNEWISRKRFGKVIFLSLFKFLSLFFLCGQYPDMDMTDAIPKNLDMAHDRRRKKRRKKRWKGHGRAL